MIWIIVNIVAVLALALLLLSLLNLRPDIILLLSRYFHYRSASARFWMYSVIPSLCIPPALVLGLIALMATGKAIAVPVLWFIERLFRRSLESERGILTLIGAGLTALAAMLTKLFELAG